MLETNSLPEGFTDKGFFIFGVALSCAYFFQGSLATIGDNVDRCISFIRSFFKQVIKTQLDKSEGQLPHELLKSIEVCLQTLAKIFKGGDSSDLPNILYHIFYLLVKQVCSMFFLKLLRCGFCSCCLQHCFSKISFFFLFFLHRFCWCILFR